MQNEKSRTAFGYTETDEGQIPHLRICGIFGLQGGSIDAPIALIPHLRNGAGLPFAETLCGMLVYVLPGGIKITSNGKLTR